MLTAIITGRNEGEGSITTDDLNFRLAVLKLLHVLLMKVLRSIANENTKESNVLIIIFRRLKL